MRLLSLKCPSCGEMLSVEESRTYTFCQYCGTKIIFNQNKSIDLKCRISIRSPEAISGTTKTIQLHKNISCKVCNGSGYQDSPTVEICPACKGFGTVPQEVQTLFGTTTHNKICPICNGKQTTMKKLCGQCNATGKISSIKNLSISIPAGTQNGAVIKINGEGEVGESQGPAGDLYIEIVVN